MPELAGKIFGEGYIGEAYKGLFIVAREKVKSIETEQITRSDEHRIVDHVYSSLEKIPIEIIEETLIQEEPREITMYRRDGVTMEGVEYVISLKYMGDEELWLYRPSYSESIFLKTRIIPDKQNSGAGTLQLIQEVPASERWGAEQIRKFFDDDLNRIKGNLKRLKEDTGIHNHQIREYIERLVKERKQKLADLSKTAKEINIPIRKRDGAPDVTLLPIKRRIVKPLPAANKQETAYGIDPEIYEYILKVIRHEGRTYDAIRNTMNKLKEEDLRNLILAHLNGHLEGEAKGEVFRGNGKTDICIEYENRAAFVAECKVWHGQNELLNAIDQLLGYLTWRDYKTALIIFKRDKAGFSGIQNKISITLSNHSKYLSAVNIAETGEWRFNFRSVNDPDRAITVHVFLFDLYVKK